MSSDSSLGPNTLLSHFGEEEKIMGAVVPPIFQNSLFVFDTFEEFSGAMSDSIQGPPYHYSRIANPSMAVAEKKLAKLEGTESAKVFSSGQGAITAGIMSCVEAGAHVVAVDTCYGPTRQLLNEYLTRFGVTVTFVNGYQAEEFFDAVQPNTKLIYLESPSSVLFRLQDIEVITKFAREKGIQTMIDNTYCTPIFSNPAKMGVDLVAHTASKYLGGHSDIIAGVLCASNERIEIICRAELALLGAALAPLPSWLLTRGLRTLGVRMQRHQETGNIVASWLEQQPQAEQVLHLGLPSFPQKDLFKKQMHGSGSLFTFIPRDPVKEKVIRFIEALEIFQLGVSWGGFESLSVPIECKPLDWPEPGWVVRLYCGLEDPEDLIADIKQALVHL